MFVIKMGYGKYQTKTLETGFPSRESAERAIASGRFDFNIKGNPGRYLFAAPAHSDTLPESDPDFPGHSTKV